MLQWALVGLCADVAITILGLFFSIITFFTHIFSLILSLFVLLPVIGEQIPVKVSEMNYFSVHCILILFFVVL